MAVDGSISTNCDAGDQQGANAPRSPELDLTVVVPTFREAPNLGLLVPRVAAALEQAGLRGEIIIVDDDSADGTEDVCRTLAETYPVRLFVRKGERGLSSAVVHGMRQARGDVLVVMDADLSHPPEAVPQLFEAIHSDQADFVIGSRYVASGSTEEGWGFYRWLNSKVASVMAWPLSAARDPMAGFFALRRSALDGADRLDPVGYKIGLELMVKCACRRIREIPIHFSNRIHGTSKLTIKEQINYLRHLRRLYWYKLTAVLRPRRKP